MQRTLSLIRNFYVALFLLLSYAGTAQNPEGFDKMLNSLVKGTVPYIRANEIINAEEEFIILDSREPVEYETSHLPQSHLIGYKNLDLSILDSYSKDQPVVVYCSVGYRSERVAERLIAMGYTRVFNLRGGIFEYANEGLPLNNEGEKASVHGYNKKWSRWLNPEIVDVVLGNSKE